MTPLIRVSVSEGVTWRTQRSRLSKLREAAQDRVAASSAVPDGGTPAEVVRLRPAQFSTDAWRGGTS